MNTIIKIWWLAFAATTATIIIALIIKGLK